MHDDVVVMGVTDITSSFRKGDDGIVITEFRPNDSLK
jgi:hypothetical protein